MAGTLRGKLPLIPGQVAKVDAGTDTTPASAEEQQQLPPAALSGEAMTLDELLHDPSLSPQVRDMLVKAASDASALAGSSPAALPEEQKSLYEEAAKTPPVFDPIPVSEATKEQQQALRDFMIPQPEEPSCDAVAELCAGDNIETIDEPEDISRTSVESPTDEGASETGVLSSPLVECPHCGWDLKETSDVAPTIEDKQRFIVCLQSGKPYSSTYELYTGQLQLRIRELRTYELDAITKEVWNQQQQGEVKSALEVYALTERYRTALQVQALNIPNKQAGQIAESLDDWNVAVAEGAVTKLPAIRELMERSVLATSSLLRVVANQVSQFNRELRHMEDNWDRPDFLDPTPSDGLS